MIRSNSQKALENLINNHLYNFLQLRNEQELEKDCNALRLTEEQIKSIVALHKLAKTKEEKNFLKILSRDYAEIYPFDFDLKHLKEAGEGDFKDFVANKKIALIGPSNSIIGSNLGKEIDSHDLVVRMNFQWPVPKDLETDIGTRTDILYHCCNGDYSINQILNDDFKDIKFVCYQKNIDSRLLRNFCNKNKIACFNVSNIYDELKIMLDTEANTGTVVISHLLKFEIKKLFIAGITLFKQPYYAGYKADGNREEYWNNKKSPDFIANHDLKKQLTYLKKIIENDSRVKIDSCLNQILKASS